MLIEEHGAGRSVAESFIATCFVRRYGSRIPGFMPRLFTLRGPGGIVRGALGLRHGDERFYAEHYLGAPIERIVAHHVGMPCDRESIVEVGHLSGDFPGAARTMIALLTTMLDARGARWVTFTGTAGLRNAFTRLGLVPTEIGVAVADALPTAERDAWGRYYDESPRVFIGSVHGGAHVLRSLARTGRSAA